MKETAQLRNYLAEKKLIILVGPEISRYSTNYQVSCCNQYSLIENGLKRCSQLGLIDSNQVQQMTTELNSTTAKVEDFYFAANQIKTLLHRENNIHDETYFSSWLNENFGNIDPTCSDLIHAIGNLDCPIITTNYDTLLETVLMRKSTTLTRLDNPGIVLSPKTLAKNILHIFGYYQDIRHLIFSGVDYEEFLDDESQHAKFEALIESKAILIIGYDDRVINPILTSLMKFLLKTHNASTNPIYMLTSHHKTKAQRQLIHPSLLVDIKMIECDTHATNLIEFIRILTNYVDLLRSHRQLSRNNELIRRKYLEALSREYGYVSIFGDNGSNLRLPLQSVYVELKFDPTHPSIKAMKSIEINDEFRRKLLAPGFFTAEELEKLRNGLMANDLEKPTMRRNENTLDQALITVLGNRKVFSEVEATHIEAKVKQLKKLIINENSLRETKQYRVQQAFNEFKHMIILGNPGSGKTTLSKWLAINMAKQCLREQNMLYDGTCFSSERLPILIPIWKYFHVKSETRISRREGLLQFICEYSLNKLSEFTSEEQSSLYWLITKTILQGKALIILEGLDEVPAYVDRYDLIQEINALLECEVDFDCSCEKLIYSKQESKELNSTQDLDMGNRFIITSRIEGNYFEEINLYIPRLTIENMSNDALKSFCNSYMDCINSIPTSNEAIKKQTKENKLYDEIIQNKDVLQLAINPQIASVIAAVYNQYDGKLPETRIELYEKAISTMIARLTTYEDYFTDCDTTHSVRLDATFLWSALQEIAQYLHSKAEGLSEQELKMIIENCLIARENKSHHQNLVKREDRIMKLVDLFKYQAGVLNEFAHDSYRFIHRTFQEYLAAKSILYLDGHERSEDEILQIIKKKISVPNWRVPLTMTFGMLSKSFRNGQSFKIIFSRLTSEEKSIDDSNQTTSLIPFSIIDSIDDIFSSKVQDECQLIQQLSDSLLSDYKNLSGFARLTEHQDLVHAYFLKLKHKRMDVLLGWFLGKLNDEENIAPCANIIRNLKWYDPLFHQRFLDHLHNDSISWNYPIDSILRFYSKEMADFNQSNILKFKYAIRNKKEMVDRIREDSVLLSLITVLYGGYNNYNVAKTIAEHHENAQFLQLDEKQKEPFLFYYEPKRGSQSIVSKMLQQLIVSQYPEQWFEKPIFKVEEIYKESFLTPIILKFFIQKESTSALIESIKSCLQHSNLKESQKMDLALVFTAMNDYQSINTLFKGIQISLYKPFQTRIDQLIAVLSDPIARYSSILDRYLLSVKQDMNAHPSKYTINFNNYCKIYMNMISVSGGLPVNTKELAEKATDEKEKCIFYSEYLAYKLTGASQGGDQINLIRSALQSLCETTGVTNILNSIIRISDAIQLYRPIRAHSWPIDNFIFRCDIENDIPISVVNMLENLHPTINFIVDALSSVFLHHGYLNHNPDLIPIVVLLNFGMVSNDLVLNSLMENLLPELKDNKDIRSLLLEYANFIGDPYYRARLFYQLAEFYDSKAHDLLNESFSCSKEIRNPVLKFQVLEKIYSIACYKMPEYESFIDTIIETLKSIIDDIDDIYNRTIAFMRFSFYMSSNSRKVYLTFALKTLGKMKESDEKLELMIKIKPVLDLYEDLSMDLRGITRSLTNDTHKNLFGKYYGRILCRNSLTNNNSNLYSQHLKPNDINLIIYRNTNHGLEYQELETLFRLFACFNDMKLNSDGLPSENDAWLNLMDNDNPVPVVEKILNTALHNEIFLTPQIALVLDRLIEENKENVTYMIMPYLIGVSHEIFPLVYRWFRRGDNETVKKWASLLLVENRRLFEAAVPHITDLMRYDNDQIRYRAQRMIQHPNRSVSIPSKHISLLGERTIKKVGEVWQKSWGTQLSSYIATFFFDLYWNDPLVFRNYHQLIAKCEENTAHTSIAAPFYEDIFHINRETWEVIIKVIPTLPTSYIEQMLHSVMKLCKENRIVEQDWMNFARCLSVTDTTLFRQQFYLIHNDLEILRIMIENLNQFDTIIDQSGFNMLESKVLNAVTVSVSTFSTMIYERIREIAHCNFYVNTDGNEEVMNILNNFNIDATTIENLVNWSIHRLKMYDPENDTLPTLILIDCLLRILATCILQDGYIYRKLTRSYNFDRDAYSKLLVRVLNTHWIYSTRGNAFILLAAMNHDDQTIIVDALNGLLDENVVKRYVFKGIPLIVLSSHQFVEELIESLQNGSAVKVYETLKIFTQFILEEKFDEDEKSKVIQYISKEIGALKSKTLVNYFYTDIRIPFTTTLEVELYKSWVKIQGLSGKTQYSE